MMRGWIIAAALVSTTAAPLLAQQPAPNRYAQRAAQVPPRMAAAPQGAPVIRQPASAAPRLHVDPQVQQAAVANTNSRPRSPRDAQNSRSNAKKSGVSSFFSRFKLPSFGGGNDEQESPQQSASNPPLPYDPAELEQEMGAIARGHQQQSAAAQQRVAAPRQTAAPNRPTTPRPTSQAAAPKAPVAAPQVKRGSPVESHRRNELAEALSDLVPSSEPAEDAAPVDEIADADIAPPAAVDGNDLPSYLQESESAPVAARSSDMGAEPLDVGEALRAEAPRRQVARSTPTPADEELAPMPATTPTAPATRPAAVAKRDVADAFRSEPSSAVPPTPVADDEEFAAAPPSAPSIASGPKATNSMRSTGSGDGGEVLFTSSQPVIASFIEGPQRIVVGRPVEYRVVVENKGNVTAREVTGAVVAPPGAELVDASASNGVVNRPTVESGQPANEIQWQLYELPAGAKQTLTIKLIPRSGREMQLGVQWNHAPVGGNAVVEIQEPKLQMEISGPSDVMFGKAQRYALTLSNPGNGVAEDVIIELTPPGADKSGVVKHKVGALAAGETKKIELELTAREAGELKIQAAATALGDLRTETMKAVICRKAELQVDWRGPEKKYAGAIATYYIRVRNPGTAAAEQVAVELALPAGAELVEASQGHAWDEASQKLTWQGATLNPGEERFMEVQCRMSTPGVNKIELAAHNAAGDLRDAKSVPVTIEGMADLKLEVVDPQGVVPVGEMAVYEIHIKNNGLTAAKGVNVIAMFSQGIEPSHVEGGQHTINDGRVSFRTLDNVAPGSETVFKIHAKASASGTHVFRAEVACQELDVKLAAEETTRFFTEEDRWADASTAYAEEKGTTTR
ncbi:MAG: DUF11 domain-containing protein [Planctomycetaceae bacterium]|nr:DUF11 domain-containing protein [Planctomycetaceae bacterium]